MRTIHRGISTEGPSAKCPMKISEIHSTTPRLNKKKLRLRGANWRREWQPPPVFLPGESHGQRSLAGHRLEKNLTQLSNSACVCRGAKSLALSHEDREKGLGDLNPGLMPKP